MLIYTFVLDYSHLLSLYWSAWSSSLQISSQVVHQLPHKTLTHLRLVEKAFASLQSSRETFLRISRDVTSKISGRLICPRTWDRDDDPDRVPRFLAKAVCPNCRNYCRAGLYYHRGLMHRCDITTGEKVWKWTVVEHDESTEIYRGYYTLALRCEFYVLVTKLTNISQVSEANEWGIVFATRT